MAEINTALVKELLQGNQDLAEWVVNRWVFKHGEVYNHFAERLEAIRPDFSTLESLNEEESEQVLRGSAEAFGPKPVYFFAMLNDVVFPLSVIEKLRLAVEAETAREAEKVPSVDTAANEKHRQEMARLIEKYEHRIVGVMKKYTTEVEMLKSQIRALQKRVG
jgi:hypothetical protein